MEEQFVINPLTKRRIKHGGSVHRKLVKNRILRQTGFRCKVCRRIVDDIEFTSLKNVSVKNKNIHYVLEPKDLEDFTTKSNDGKWINHNSWFLHCVDCNNGRKIQHKIEKIVERMWFNDAHTEYFLNNFDVDRDSHVYNLVSFFNVDRHHDQVCDVGNNVVKIYHFFKENFDLLYLLGPKYDYIFGSYYNEFDEDKMNVIPRYMEYIFRDLYRSGFVFKDHLVSRKLVDRAGWNRENNIVRNQLLEIYYNIPDEEDEEYVIGGGEFFDNLRNQVEARLLDYPRIEPEVIEKQHPLFDENKVIVDRIKKEVENEVIDNVESCTGLPPVLCSLIGECLFGELQEFRI